jgi:serine phosphatase RsbU (regulator of sigma subunit)
VVATPIVLVGLGVALSHTMPTDELSQSMFSVLQVGVLGGAVLIPAALIARTERQLRNQLDAARRRDEHHHDVDTVVEAITSEMVVVTPEMPGWEIGMRYRPATGHLAGDSVQVHHRMEPQPATLIAIVDIAGHDAYAAVVAYGLRAHIGALWEYGADLAAIVSSANAKVVRRRTIATGVLLSFEHGSHEVQFVNAGHPPPIHVHAGHMSTWSATGPLLGIETGQHAVHNYDVKPGDLIVSYTDGLVEAQSRTGAQLGERTLHRLIHSYRDQPVGDIADACMDAAMQHAAARLRDDALVVVARRR